MGYLTFLDRIAEEEESNTPMKKEYRAQLYSLLQQGYLDDVDANVLYSEEEEPSQLPGVLGKASNFMKRKASFFPPKS